MFVILVYDVRQNRVTKVLKKCREYLYWVQNSVFEGEISKAQLKILQDQLKSIINVDEDSVIVYSFRSRMYSSVDVIGVEKGDQETIL